MDKDRSTVSRIRLADSHSKVAGSTEMRRLSAEIGGEQSSSSEKTKLVEKVDEFCPPNNLRISVLVVSWLTIVILLSMGSATFVIAVQQNSAASFAFALDAFLDCATSSVVIWRYTGEKFLYSQEREKRTCIILGALFIVSGLFVIIRSIVAIVLKTPSGESVDLWHIAIGNGSVCVALFIAKAFLAYKLRSTSVATDAFNSAIGAVMAFSILIGDLEYTKHHWIWMVDPIIGVVCGALLFVYGTWVIVYQILFNDNVTIR